MPTLSRLTGTAAVAVALSAPAAAQAQDRVSPDARLGMRSATPAVPQTRIVEVPSSGFQWGDAAVGAAATLAIVLLLAGGTVTAGRRGGANPR